MNKIQIFVPTVPPSSTFREVFTDRSKAAEKAAELIRQGYDISVAQMAADRIVVNGER